MPSTSGTQRLINGLKFSDMFSSYMHALNTNTLSHATPCSALYTKYYVLRTNMLYSAHQQAAPRFNVIDLM